MYRIIPVKIWQLPDFEDWTFKQKSFYFYLVTCHLTNTAGVFVLAKKHMMVDTSIPRDEIQELLDFLEESGEIVVNEKRDEAWITRFISFQSFSGSVMQKVEKLIMETESEKIISAYRGEEIEETKKEKKKESKKEEVRKEPSPERKIAEFFEPSEAGAMIGTLKKFLKEKFEDFVSYAFEKNIMQRAKNTEKPIAYVIGAIKKTDCMIEFNRWRSERRQYGD